MKAYESVIDKLMDEFSHGTIDIVVSDISSVIVDHPDDQDGLFQYDFYIIFNKDFKSSGSLLSPVNEEYQKYIDKERLSLYDEINELVLSTPDHQKILFLLLDYNHRFEEILSFYKKRKYNRYSNEEIFVKNIRYNTEKSHKGRPIYYEYEWRLTSSFFTVQLDAIEKILDFLILKIDFLKELGKVGENTDPSKKRTLKPDTSLDRFQTALIFHYLQDAGAIRDLSSYKKLAHLIQELTDHSENTLSKECLNQIQDIKMGIAGNKPEIIKNKAYNLEQVRLIMRKMINSLERDLKNNRDSQNK